MQTKEDLISELEKRIGRNINEIRDNISYLHDALNEIDSSLNSISYLTWLKGKFKKED